MSTTLQVIADVPVLTVDTTTPPHIGEQLSLSGGSGGSGKLSSWSLQARVLYQGVCLGAAQVVIILQDGTTMVGEAVITDWITTGHPDGSAEVRALSNGPPIRVQTPPHRRRLPPVTITRVA